MRYRNWINLKAVPLWLFEQFRGRFIVYALKWSDKEYVGSSTNLAVRLQWWLGTLKSVPSLELRILASCASKEEMLVKEEQLIRRHRTFERGHNATTHGRSGATAQRNGNWRRKRPANVGTAVARANSLRQGQIQDTVKRFAFGYGDA